jgi:Phosphoribosylformylglycinamidine (FGAM) synthase, glutamine amidotransferase domain
VSSAAATPIAALFAEELGLVLEVADENVDAAVAVFDELGVGCLPIGRTLAAPTVRIAVDGEVVLEDDVRALRDLWEATSFELEKLQADPGCVEEERRGLAARTAPPFALGFEPRPTAPEVLARPAKVPVAVLREEGSNSDREMAAALALAGFEPADVTMSDLLAGRAHLDDYRGLVAVGGFSYADVLNSAKGWAGTIRFNRRLAEQFEAFRSRPDTFALGVCNGCQLFALLGWVPWRGIPDLAQPRFIANASGRFESRFATVRILDSPSIFLRGMAGSVLGIWLQHGEGGPTSPIPPSWSGWRPRGWRRCATRTTAASPRSATPSTPTARRTGSPPSPPRTAATWPSCPTPSAPS